MIDAGKISAESALLDEATKATIQNVFGRLTKDVVLKAVVALQQEKSAEMASFLKGVAALSPHIQVEFYGPEEADGLEMDTEHLPATGFYLDGVYQRVAFHGVPGGKEINSFVIGIYNLAGPGQEIAAGTLKKIGKLKKPVHAKICVSLACHHCPGVVIACQQIAMKSDCISAEMYDANLYPDLVERYKIERVPLVALNDRDVFMGPRTIEDLVQLFKDAK
ncbi:MAG: thioredoxin family protein [Eubacteriales bacterium]|nr:thioredoxin family protein [Eubacteriales bacterium]